MKLIDQLKRQKELLKTEKEGKKKTINEKNFNGCICRTKMKRKVKASNTLQNLSNFFLPKKCYVTTKRIEQ